MFESIARFFGASDAKTSKAIEPELAVAALLIHLSAVDGQTSQSELRVIALSLQKHYGLAEAEVKKLIDQARSKDREAVDFYQFTSTLSTLPEQERIAIISMMWQVVFVDDDMHEMEDNMVWRVAELIGISSRDRVSLRSRIKKQLSISNTQDVSRA